MYMYVPYTLPLKAISVLSCRSHFQYHQSQIIFSTFHFSIINYNLLKINEKLEMRKNLN